MIKGLILGLIAGVIGAGVWAAVSFYTGYEVGFIAWGIGLLVGIGMIAGAQDQASGATGAVAAVIALAAVLGGKYATVHLAFEDLVQASGGWTYTEHDMLVVHADEVVVEWEDEGRTVDWPSGMTIDEAYEEEDYPPEVWAEARTRWDALSDQDQKTMLAEYQAGAQAAMSQARQEGFLRSFSLFDILWIGLAVVTALKLGSGGTE